MNRRPTVYKTAALPLSYVGERATIRLNKGSGIIRVFHELVNPVLGSPKTGFSDSSRTGALGLVLWRDVIAFSPSVPVDDAFGSAEQLEE